MRKDDKLAPGAGGLRAVNLACGSAEHFTKAMSELYDAVLLERIPDDIRALVEKLK